MRFRAAYLNCIFINSIQKSTQKEKESSSGYSSEDKSVKNKKTEKRVREASDSRLVNLFELVPGSKVIFG